MTLLEYFPSMISYEGVDLMALPEQHERWKTANSHIAVKVSLTLRMALTLAAE